MVANDPHNRKQPLLLGMIALVSGIILALFLLDKVHAAYLNPSVFDADFLVSSSDDSRSIYGYNGNLYIVDDWFTRDPEAFNVVESEYWYWYGNNGPDLVSRWGFYNIRFNVIKGSITNNMNKIGYISLDKINTIDSVNLKEFLSDENVVVTYFEDNYGVKWAYVSYVANYLDYEFDSFTINTSHHFVEWDPIYREFYRWDSGTSSWDRQTVTNEQVYVDTILKGYLSIKLMPEASVKIKSSRFLIDDPVPTSTPSPTPTPDPFVTDYYVFIPSTYSASYDYNYMFTFKASGINREYAQPDDDDWEYIKAQYPDTTNILKYNAAIFRPNRYSGSWLGNFYGRCAIFYFQVSSISDVKLYSYSGNIVSSPEAMLSVGTVSDGVISDNNNYSSPSYYIQNIDGGYCIALVFRYSEYSTPNFSAYDSNVWFQEYTISNSDNVNYSLPFKSGSLQYRESLMLRLDVENNAVPDPNVTPTPEPTSTPTPPPYVIIITPDPSPTPTPPFVIPTMPPWNPPGNQLIPLDPDILNDVFGEFSIRLGDNNSFGLFGLLISLLPGDLMWYLWFLLFILLVVGVAKLIIHFTGG